MRWHRRAWCVLHSVLFMFAVTGRPAAAQVMEGELRVTIQDPSGRPVPALVAVVGHSPEFRAETRADRSGHARISRLPMGVYAFSVTHDGFADLVETVAIRSAVPQDRAVTLRIGLVPSAITVETPAPLLDRAEPILVLHAGRERLTEALGTTLGRSVIDVVTTMPGWLLEANAVLHPRGSEYDTQYVIDGMPLYDNRSIGFAPAFELTEFEAVNVITAGIPAEYGRRLGGVIALDTRRAGVRGHSTEADFLGGSYGTYFGALTHQFASHRTSVSVGAQGGHTDRYLDPPSLDNFTNRGSATGFNVRVDRDLSDHDKLALYLRSNRTTFLVPNDLLQQAAGQRQDRTAGETAGRMNYQRVVSSRSLVSIQGMVRDVTARLWSNPFATPVHVDQDRGFREGAVLSTLTVEGESNTFKFGADVRVNAIRESFRFARPEDRSDSVLSFADRQRSTDSSLFVQDHVRFGNLSASVGLRLDHYRLLIRDTALSPRLALSYYVPAADLLLRASFDRVFQPPPVENLLLSSALGGLPLEGVEGTLAVPASRGNFFEVGVRKAIASRLRLDVSHYWRTFRDYVDDDVFLNTGLSFPITFDTARIQGTELRLEMPRWRRVSSYLSYSNMLGTAASPVTGGLFIEGGEAEELRSVVRRFPISQDQRNTLAAQVRVEPHRRLWFAGGTRYGSGLPVELADDDEDAEPISSRILRRVNFERGRLRPNFSLDLATGLQVVHRNGQNVWLQFDVRNATDRLNVLNFSGLFSGTALAPGRQVSVQVRARF